MPYPTDERIDQIKPTLVVFVQTVLSPIFSRALRSGIDYLYEVGFVGRGGLEPPLPDFQSGALTIFATDPYGLRKYVIPYFIEY